MPDATEVSLKDVSDVMPLLDQAMQHRTTGATAANHQSSRSHMVFTLSVMNRPDQRARMTTASLRMSDLAGSEMLDAKAAGSQQAETKSINKSLLALRQVITMLSEPHDRPHHIPYRSSKLTRLLSSCLGGNARTTVLLCCNQAQAY